MSRNPELRGRPHDAPPPDARTDPLLRQAVELHRAGRLDEAEAMYRRLLELDADHLDALNWLGTLRYQTGAFADAIRAFERSLQLSPNQPFALTNLGNTLVALQRYDEALAQFERSIRAGPDYAPAHNNRGNALCALHRHDEAIASYDRAIAINHNYAIAHNNRANALCERRRYAEAVAGYRRALRLSPDYPYLRGAMLHARQQICDWAGLDDDFRHILAGIDKDKRFARPFAALTTPASAAQQRRCAEIYTRDKYPAAPDPLWEGERHAHEKLRIGYFSTDFREHAVAYLAAGLFERHDRTRFDVTAFSLDPPADDAMRRRLEPAFDRFLEVHDRSNRDIAMMAREMEIDIAVDMNGFTQSARPEIFTHRAAPIQVNYLGYPGTMGAAYMDYLIADPVLIPAEHRRFYAEKIAYLPDTYQANDSRRSISDRQFTRRQLGLPEPGFVFCCFNSSFKISPAVFDIWMRLLRDVTGSVLWLLPRGEAAKENLGNEAERRGISGERLVFAGTLPVAEHLARHRLADLALDTPFYNGHTTTADALWAGLPVLTCLGETFAGRVAASILAAAGLPDLVARSWPEYESLALELATRPEKLQHIRGRLAANRDSHPLFDTARYTRHLESLYEHMWQRHQQGLAPDHLTVDDIPTERRD